MSKTENHLFTARTAIIAVVTIILTLLVIAGAHAAFETFLHMQDIVSTYR